MSASHLSRSKIDRQIYHNIYEPLLTLDANLGIKPGLAESWQLVDAKTLVFKLRRGVKFDDGTDFNAEAAKFNFNRMKTEPKSVRKGETASIETVDVVDAYAIRMNLKRPDAALPATLTDRAGMMVSPKAIQERGAELERNATGAGTGPFQFAEWVKDDHLLIKRNDNYWNKQGALSRPDPLPAHPRRHREVAEPPGGRDPGDGLRAASRRRRGKGGQERGGCRWASCPRRAGTGRSTGRAPPSRSSASACRTSSSPSF
ncbi:MAG TPA: ABC transporter substrate-binding protein [Verrucomicrobiae bacterium]|nr:ABC transporter substrate-binding protein [Verrucomicrobiae bacterium]